MKDDADMPPASEQAVAVAAPRKRARRSRRQRGLPRARTVPLKRITREDLRIGALMYPVVDVQRPRTREECRGGLRPCPWVGCKFSLYLDVNPRTGSIKLNFADLEPWELAASCALDEAERGGLTLEEIAERTNLTRERVRQVEIRGLHTLQQNAAARDLEVADLGSFATKREATLPSMGSGAWWSHAGEATDEPGGE